MNIEKITKIKLVSIFSIKSHPENIDIYGVEDVTELAEAINKSNRIEPLIVNQDNILISGHRRLQAAELLGLDKVPVCVKETKDKLHLLELLLLMNEQRKKTNWQKMREAKKWEKIETQKAKDRKSKAVTISNKNRSKNNNQPSMFEEEIGVPKVPNWEPLEIKKQKTIEAVSERIGMKKNTYDRGKKVVKKIEELQEQGKDKEANIIKAALNKSVSGALKLSEQNLENLEEEVIEKLQNDEVNVSQVVKEVKKAERKEKKQAIVDKGKSVEKLPNSIQLLEGDLFEQIDNIGDSTIDLLNTDPPYFVLDDEWDRFDSLGHYLEFTESWLKKVMPKVKSTGRVYISFPQWYEHDIYEIFKRNDFFGFIFKQKIIWYYKNNNQPSNRKEYRYMYEPIFYLYGKDAPVLNFTPDTYGETQQNVWEIATPQSNFKEGKFHSAQKPLELYRRIIKTGSFENDKILDCFAGSGTSGIVCDELNRECVLIEKDNININLIKGRLNEKL